MTTLLARWSSLPPIWSRRGALDGHSKILNFPNSRHYCLGAPSQLCQTWSVRIFTCMKRRDTAEVALHINAYSCGFPCTPFLSSISRVFILPLNTSGPSVHSDSDLSMLMLPSLLARFSQLHFQSRFLQEKAAEPFFLCLEEVARSLPLIALLENVLGLLRCWNQVERALKRLEAFGYVAAKVSSPWDSTFNVFSPNNDEFDPKSWYLFGHFY